MRIHFSQAEASGTSSRILVPKIERHLANPAYEAFIDSLQAAYDLHQMNPKDLRWASINAGVSSIGFPPSVVIDSEEGVPKLAIGLYPKENSNLLTGSDVYHAPVLLQDVQRWGLSSKTLGNYKVQGWSGVTEDKEMFRQPLPLTKIIEGFELEEAISDSTPIIEGIVLLPIAPNGEFATEFTPQIRFGDLDHKYYKIAVVNQDRLSAYSLLTQGQYRQVQDIDQNQNHYNFLAEHVPDLSEIEKLLLPGNTGHMILIVTPVEDPMAKFKFDSGSADDYGFGFRGGPQTLGGDFLKGSPTRGASIGDIRIGRGSHTGKGSLYEGELSHSNEGKSVIYHLRFLGVKPEQARALKEDDLSRLATSISGFSQN